MGISNILWLILSACTSDKTTLTPQPQFDSQFSNAVFILDITETDADWVDFAYLSAIPTSTIVNQGSPALLSLGDEPHPASLDLLHRLDASSAIHLNNKRTIAGIDAAHVISATNAAEYSLRLPLQSGKRHP